jgi:hypothetical protein
MQSVEAMLRDRWFELRRTRVLRRRAVPQGLQAVLGLLGRMMFFVKRYLAFMFLEVIDPQWHTMMQRVQSASSLDEVCPTCPCHAVQHRATGIHSCIASLQPHLSICKHLQVIH